MTATVSRRQFVQAAAGGTGLLLALALPGRRLGAAGRPSDTVSFTPSAFLEVAPDGTVTVWSFRAEMGQGIMTAVAVLVAEELDVAWRAVRVLPAPADPRFGDMRVGGSRSIRSYFLPLRQAGAAARAMLVSAAAHRWKVEAATLETAEGVVRHPPSGRRVSYGDLVEDAAALPVPESPALKDRSRFRLIGRRVPRVDTPAKVDGSARFGLDVRVPGMRFAALVRPPRFGATLQSFDAAAAGAVPGVSAVVRAENAVAVVADSTWAAQQAAAKVQATWHGGAGLDSSDIDRALQARSRESPAVARSEGDPDRALTAGARRVEAEYRVPFLAHATMEPQNCTADVGADRAELWIPTQNPIGSQELAMELTGLPRERVTVHTTFLGGGFGRRGERDFVREAVLVSRAVRGPVQLVWSREDDMRNDLYRPATFNRFAAAVDDGGRLAAWYHCIAGPSILSRFGPLPGGVDRTSVEGAANLPYAVPNLRVEYCRYDSPVPVGFWRSVGSSQNAFVTECFMDEVAALAGADPFEFRRRHLASDRARAVLELAAARAGWGSPLPAGRFRGIAYAESFGSRVAEVAEISVSDRQVRVHRVVCAIDAGQVVQPDTVVAQMESGIVYGLTAALHGEITLTGGGVVQSNFHDYPLLRIGEMPAIEVHIVPSTEAPGGVGEPGTPPIAPAVANAVFQATGTRVRRLPIRL